MIKDILLRSDIQLILCFVLPLAVMFASRVIRNANVRETLNILVAVSLCSIVYALYKDFWYYNVQFKMEWLTLIPGASIAFSVSTIGLIFAAIVSILWLVTTIYSIGYLRANLYGKQGRFFAFFALSIAATFGIALADNLLTLFLFYELLTLSTYPLVTFSANDDARRAGRRYLTILMGASVLFFLPAMLITYQMAGTLDFTDGGILRGTVSPSMLGFLLFLFVFGTAKAAVMPVHKWLPAAMVAPTPVSALLHAVAVVKAGVFTIIRIITDIVGVDFLSKTINDSWFSGQWLVYLTAITVVVASIIALYQDNLKRRLAYSTIGQLSYIVMAAATLAPKSLTAAAFHMVVHAFGKITLFFAAGSIYTASKKKNVSQLDGIGHRMPWTMTAFTVGALTMVAVPPTAGFVSKWYMVEGAFSREVYIVVIALVLSTVLNAMYFVPIVIRAFFAKEKKGANHGEAPWPMVLALSFTALMAGLLFFYPFAFFELAEFFGEKEGVLR